MNDGELADQLKEWAHIALRDNAGTAMADIMLAAARRLHDLHAHTMDRLAREAERMMYGYCRSCARSPYVDDVVEHCSDCSWVAQARAAGFELPVSHVVVDETVADMEAREAAEPPGAPVDVEKLFPTVTAPRGRIRYQS